MSSQPDPSRVKRVLSALRELSLPNPEYPYSGFDEDWWTDHSQRRKAFITTLYWTFNAHALNDPMRKRVTTILVLTWAVVTIGKAYGLAEAGNMYPYISVLVFAIVCTIWGFELGMLNSITGAHVKHREEQNTKDQDGGEK